MKISQLFLNSDCLQARKDLANPHNLHRTLMRAFPSPLPINERVLFRVEMKDTPAPAVVLVQSMTEPDWIEVEKHFTGYFKGMPQIKNMEGIHLTNGANYRFRLRANPSKRVIYKDSQNSQRISLFSENDRRDWLIRKSKSSGFEVIGDRLIIQDAPYRTIIITKEKVTRKAIINMVDYDGLLRVTDPQTLLKTMQQGIGPAKGLGCGLLSLALL